ncbi:MAG: sigma-54-dependent Fis family transcriptional regulator [Pirellulales bacterium]|nr:sigma-54-dependent Fis family transcriptional regulator [Pirellulales bacterium]
MSKILVVDDEPSICWGLGRLGESLGHAVEIAASAEQGLRAAELHRFDLLILDVRLPGMDGLTAMQSFRQAPGETPIIVITAFGDLATAVKAVEQGAFEYVLKPFDLHEIRAAVERALRATPAAPMRTASESDGMLGQSPTMQAVFKRIALAAASDAEVLLSGESGVGKELAAHAIHRHSARRDGPFVAVNIAALSPSLAEAELFGHVAGAFTGAQQARKGLLVQADGGTLFIDEAAEIPLPIQVKLLRALDQGEVLPVGADAPVKTLFRVVSASHRNLHERVEAGAFRHDLLYRLCTFEITLPPLRQRGGDVRLLANHFATQFGHGAATLAEETLVALESRSWFGNVRELRNAVEHALVLARSRVVLPNHLPAPLPGRRDQRGDALEGEALSTAAAKLANDLLGDADLAGGVYERYLQEIERPLLASAMSRSGNQCAPAARVLGLHRTTLKRKLDQLGLAGSVDDRETP